MNENNERGSSTILLVEDEPFVRDAAVEVLAAAGYRVIAARDSAQALQLCSESFAAIDLLLSDLVLPGMSGSELARMFVQFRPQGRVLLMSGHAQPLTSLPTCTGPIHLPKPFSSVTLLEKVGAILAPNPLETSAPIDLGFQPNV